MRHLPAQYPVLIDLVACIDTGNRVFETAQLAAGEQCANVRVNTEVALHPCHANQGLLAKIRAGGRQLLALGFIVHDQGAHRHLVMATGDARAHLRIDDAAREEERLRGLEKARIFKEEGPLLGKLHLVALVDDDLRLVRFHFAEIRIERQVHRKRIGQNELGVDTGLVLVVLFPERRIRVVVIEGAAAADVTIRIDLDIATRGDLVLDLGLGELRYESFLALGHIRPV